MNSDLEHCTGTNAGQKKFLHAIRFGYFLIDARGLIQFTTTFYGSLLSYYPTSQILIFPTLDEFMSGKALSEN